MPIDKPYKLSYWYYKDHNDKINREKILVRDKTIIGCSVENAMRREERKLGRKLHLILNIN